MFIFRLALEEHLKNRDGELCRRRYNYSQLGSSLSLPVSL